MVYYLLTNTKQSLVRKLYLVLSLFWTIAILVLCLMDLSDVNTVKRVRIPHADKIVHLLMYTILSFLWGMVLLRTHFFKEVNHIILIMSFVIFGLAIEILQGYGGFNRSFEWQDIVANTIGVIIGYFICLKILNFKPHKS